MMYVLEYLIYHLKPFGHNTVLKTVCSNSSLYLDNSTASNTKDASQGGNSNQPSVSKGGIQAAGEQEEGMEKNIQEDFVETPEIIDRSLTVNAEEEHIDDETAKRIKRIQENIHKSFKNSNNMKEVDHSNKKVLTDNQSPQLANSNPVPQSSKLLTALKTKNLLQ